MTDKLEELHIGEPITPTEYGDMLLYKDEFVHYAQKALENNSGYPCEQLIRCYDELYYHYNEGEIDWALVKADSFFCYTTGYENPYCVKLDRVFRSDVYKLPFKTTYAIYTPSTGKFYDIMYFDNLDGLQEALDAVNAGEKLGDLNHDGKLNINDATEMQYCLAQKHDFPANDGVEADGYYKTSYHPSVYYLSDVDKNGKRDINDVTAIQKIIAKV